MTIKFKSEDEAKMMMKSVKYLNEGAEKVNFEVHGVGKKIEDLSEKILSIEKKIAQTMADMHNVMFMVINAVDDIATLTARVSMLEEKSSPDQKKENEKC